MDKKGDIPERDDIILEIDEELVSNEAKRKIGAIETLVEKGGAQGHFYLPNMKDGEDVHLEGRFTHFFTEQGYLYWHANDKDRWAFGDDIIMIESHYKD